MSEPRDRSRLARFVRRFWWVLVLIVLAAVALLALLARNANRVSWAEVRQVCGRQKTINGVGRAIDVNGREWQYALWVEVVGPSKFAPNVMLLPPKGAPAAGLNRDFAELLAYLDYTGGFAYITALADRHRAARGKPTEWAGKPALEVTIPTPVDLLNKRGLYPSYAPDALRFYLDPETKLIRALEVFKGGTLRAKVEYRYNLPLPKGFRPK